MAMFLGVVELQHLVGVRHGLGELARTTVASAGNCVSRDQQVGIAGRLREVQHLLHPRQGLRYAPLRHDVLRQSPEDGRQRVVALERLRQGKCRMQAGPDFRGGPAFERHPCGAKAAAQPQFAGVSLR